MSEKRALVIDDSQLFRLVLRTALERFSFTVEQANDGAEALGSLHRGGVPDVIVVDWNMPDLDGIELVNKVRSNPILSNVRIIMVTSETKKDKIELALSQGVDFYLTKPVQDTDLFDALRALGLV